MKLPENKKDRQKIYLVVGLVVAAAVYALWAWVYGPILKGRNEARAKIRTLEGEISAAADQISRIPLTERAYLQVVTNLVALSEQQMMHPRLGNYLLPAREILQRQARAVGLLAVQIDEIGLAPLPRPKEKAKPVRKPDDKAEAPATPVKKKSEPPPLPPYTVQAYAVRVSTECSYETLRRWMDLLEQENPLVAIGGITVAAQPDDPLKHQVSFEVQWPAWVDPDFRETLQEMEAE